MIYKKSDKLFSLTKAEKKTIKKFLDKYEYRLYKSKIRKIVKELNA